MQDESASAEIVASIGDQVAARERDVRQLVSAEKKGDALRKALENPPLQATDQGVKVRSCVNFGDAWDAHARVVLFDVVAAPCFNMGDVITLSFRQRTTRR